MAESKITTLNKITNPTVSNLRQNSAIYVRQIGRLVFGTVDAASIPSGTWTTIGIISSKPIGNFMASILNSSVSSFGELNININGEVRIYHTRGSDTTFINQSFMYIS